MTSAIERLLGAVGDLSSLARTSSERIVRLASAELRSLGDEVRRALALKRVHVAGWWARVQIERIKSGRPPFKW